MVHLLNLDQEQEALLSRTFEMLSKALDAAGTDMLILANEVSRGGSQSPCKIVLQVLRGQAAEEVMQYATGALRGPH